MHKIETLLYAVVHTAHCQHGLQACTIYGTSGNTGCMKLAVCRETCMKEGQCCVISFWLSRLTDPLEMYCHLQMQYGNVRLSLQQAYESNKKYKNGMFVVWWKSLDWAKSIMLQGIVERQCIVSENLCIKVNEVAGHHSWLILLSATFCIFTKCPNSGVTQQFCLKSIVTGDESWIDCFEPAMKRVSKEWCHFSSSRPRKRTACRLLQEMWCRHCSWISTAYLLGTT
jgi:hypothetical protein